MKPQTENGSQIEDTSAPEQSSPQVVPLELLRQVSGGLPYNVGASAPQGFDEMSLPYNVG